MKTRSSIATLVQDILECVQDEKVRCELKSIHHSLHYQAPEVLHLTVKKLYVFVQQHFNYPKYEKVNTLWNTFITKWNDEQRRAKTTDTITTDGGRQ